MADIRSKTAPAQYIYLDIVGYSKDRTVEAQTEIVETLNRIVLSALEMYKISRRKYIPIPTGDGICIALLDVQEPFDVALLISIYILHNVVASNEKQKEKMREFAIRIGINENTDNLVKDISGKKNIAGAGITYSQRIMDLADPNQILVGRTVFEKLHQREKYYSSFKKYVGKIKHNQEIEVFQYLEPDMYYLNNKPPFACIKQKSRIEPELLPISAYYIALTTKYSHIVRTLLEDPVDANTFQLVFIYLSKDLMNIRQKSEYDVDLYLTFGDYISGKNIDIEGTFKFVKQTHHDFVIDLADFYINNLITKRYINDLFEEGSHFLSPNKKGKCKLKDNYPDIIDYLEIAL